VKIDRPMIAIPKSLIEANLRPDSSLPPRIFRFLSEKCNGV